MSLKNTAGNWGSVARFFHWATALLIIGNGAYGLWMTGLSPSMKMINAYALHKSIGLTVLGLLLLRMAWRFSSRAPRALPMPRWQHIAAHAVHGFLYLLALAMPLSGWWANSLKGFPLQYFKQINLPSLGGVVNHQWADVVITAHLVIFWSLIALVVIHALAALKHHFIDRDATLKRMLPFARAHSEVSSIEDFK
ncbi:Cytochrome b561 [Carnimonas sp. R-84981]|uniref:cytochrome b n=1 Tax=Carnimonas bestiolae TaxID=3402172 RepID=UPI003EDBA931